MKVSKAFDTSSDFLKTASKFDTFCEKIIHKEKLLLLLSKYLLSDFLKSVTKFCHILHVNLALAKAFSSKFLKILAKIS